MLREIFKNLISGTISTPNSNEVIKVGYQTSQKADTLEMQRFWKSIVVPILQKNKKQVMSNMDFPILGDWTKMMEMNAKPRESTSKDFEISMISFSITTF